VGCLLGPFLVVKVTISSQVLGGDGRIGEQGGGGKTQELGKGKQLLIGWRMIEVVGSPGEFWRG
jgi:hypothetical protein